MGDGTGAFGRGVQKNIAIFGDRIFGASSRATIFALDARSGKLIWETQTADTSLGYRYTAGPIVANGKLVTGITGCGRYKDDVCFITGHDPDTGEEILAHLDDRAPRRARRRHLGATCRSASAPAATPGSPAATTRS